MGPIRIAILTFLFYILFRLLIGSAKKNKVDRRESGSGNRGPAQDVLREDPVCHTLIPARKAITLNKDGEILYFCSQGCRDQYINQRGEQK